MHKIFSHNPRSTPSGRKVRAERRRERKKEKITLLIEATMFAMQPVYNAGRAAPALCPDQFRRTTTSYKLISPMTAKVKIKVQESKKVQHANTGRLKNSSLI